MGCNTSDGLARSWMACCAAVLGLVGCCGGEAPGEGNVEVPGVEDPEGLAIPMEEPGKESPDSVGSGVSEREVAAARALDQLSSPEAKLNAARFCQSYKACGCTDVNECQGTLAAVQDAITSSMWSCLSEVVANCDSACKPEGVRACLRASESEYNARLGSTLPTKFCAKTAACGCAEDHCEETFGKFGSDAAGVDMFTCAIALDCTGICSGFGVPGSIANRACTIPVREAIAKRERTIGANHAMIRNIIDQYPGGGSRNQTVHIYDSHGRYSHSRLR